jgi:hypothetical protein
MSMQKETHISPSHLSFGPDRNINGGKRIFPEFAFDQFQGILTEGEAWHNDTQHNDTQPQHNNIQH